jgi:putative toxin-antitoxin system antitoxin component (TIGR02293 family)
MVRNDLATAGRSELCTLFERVIVLFGGRQIFSCSCHSRFDVHDCILNGIPSTALLFFVKHVQLQSADMEKAIGINRRELRRLQEREKKTLNVMQGGRVWKFAEILAKSSEVFGSQSLAEMWLSSSALALDYRRPIDLLSTPVGVEIIEQLLGRFEYGVYT